MLFFFEWYSQRILFFELIIGMDRLEEYADEESPYTEWNNFQKEPIEEEITNNSSKLLKTVKELKIEMELVKKENERILRDQEELNQILMERFHTKGKDKRTESEDMGYQHKDKKTKQVCYLPK